MTACSALLRNLTSSKIFVRIGILDCLCGTADGELTAVSLSINNVVEVSGCMAVFVDDSSSF